MNYKIIAVDFDGTLCENKWPKIGNPNQELIAYLKKQQASGDVKLILWTCRVGKKLTDAIRWCYWYNLHFDYVNENTDEVIKEFGSDCRKIFAHEYIDDRSVNRPEFSLPYAELGMEQQLDNLTFEMFSRLYDCTITNRYEIEMHGVVYKFWFNTHNLGWTHVIPYSEFKEMDLGNPKLENTICQEVIANLMDRGVWPY